MNMRFLWIFTLFTMTSNYSMEQRPSATEGLASCFFCDLNNRDHDIQNFVLYCSVHWIVQMHIDTNLFVHVNIVPIRHLASIVELTQEEIDDLALVSQRCVKVLKTETNFSGINWCYQEEQSGALHHFHIQFASRSSSDAGFILMLCKAKVIIRNHKLLYEKLKRLFAECV